MNSNKVARKFTSRSGYSAHGKCNFTGKNAPVNGEIFGRETGPESGHVPKNSLFWKIELKLNGRIYTRDELSVRNESSV